VPIFIYQDMIVGSTLRFFVYMLPFILIGTYCGRRLLTVLSQRIFDFLVLIFAGFSSLWLLFF